MMMIWGVGFDNLLGVKRNLELRRVLGFVGIFRRGLVNMLGEGKGCSIGASGRTFRVRLLVSDRGVRERGTELNENKLIIT